jgi:hypothetical protein
VAMTLVTLTVNRRIALVVAGILAASAGWTGVALADREGPVDVVRAYFAAITSRDVQAALGLIDRWGSGVPVGAEAALLTPAAIADGWRLQSAAEQHRDDERREATVEVTLASRHGTASGDLLLVRGRDGPWRLHAPLVLVEVQASPLQFVQANGVSVPARQAPPLDRFWLFPGLYEFYHDLPDGVRMPPIGPVMALPQNTSRYAVDDGRPLQLAPGRLDTGDPIIAAVEQQLAARLDDCATFSTTEPFRCPFATDGELDTQDGQRIREPSDLDWHITGYPQLALVDDRPPDLYGGGFLVVADQAGQVRLSGAGTDTDGDSVEFAVDCAIEVDPLGLRASITAAGQVALSTPGGQAGQPEHAGNTCHRNP